MQAAQTAAPSTLILHQPGAITISDEIAAARRRKIESLFASIDFIPDRPAATVLDALCKLHCSQFQIAPDSYTKQVNWTPVTPARSPYGAAKARRILCVRRPDNTLEALMPVGHVLKNPGMKTGRFAYKAIFFPDDPYKVELRAAFLLTAVYPISGKTGREAAQKNLLDAEKTLRLFLNNCATHFPKLENWGFKQGNHVFDVKENGLTTKKKLPCQKLVMEDECLELNLAQFLEKFRTISDKEILEIIIRVLEALEKMYEGGPGKGFVHCDVKRENIILKRHEGKWIAYLTDVGLATLIGSNVIYYIGTPRDWPPDYCEAVIQSKNATYTEAYDLWTVGMLAWEMLGRVYEQRDWHGLKIAQYSLGLYRAYPKKFDNPQNLDQVFQFLYPEEFYEDRWRQEKQDFFAKKKTYTPHLLFTWLNDKWNAEKGKFELSIKQKYPTLTWLHGLLRLDPADRQAIRITLEQIKDHHASLPDAAPPLALTQPPPPAFSASRVLPQSQSLKDDPAAESVHAMLRSEVHTQLMTPPEGDHASESWWGWSWLKAWGKGGSCSLQ